MAQYSVDSLVEDVRVALDNNNSSSVLTNLGDVDTLTTDEIIRSKIEDAALSVESAAARELLDAGDELPGDVVWDADQSSVTVDIADSDTVGYAAVDPDATDTTLDALGGHYTTKPIYLTKGSRLEMTNASSSCRVYLLLGEFAAGAAIKKVATASGGKVVYEAVGVCRVVLMDVTGGLVGKSYTIANAVSLGSNGSGYIALPDDFMRLVSFKMSDWERAVTLPITEDDSSYAQQRSKYNGGRGCPQRPVVALAMHEDGMALEFYTSAPFEAEVERALYLAIPKITNGQIELCPKLKRAVVYYAAYLSAQTWGAAEQAAVLLAISKDMAGIPTEEVKYGEG